MDKKSIKGLDRLKTAGTNLQVSNNKIEEKKHEYSDKNDVVFAVTLPVSMIAYLKELVIFKMNEDYSYSEGSAVREGIELLQGVSPFVKQRPEEVPVPTKKGRRTTADKTIIKKNTSFLISESDLNFVYNFIYHKQKGGGVFIKEELFTLLIELLENKYKLKAKK